MPHNRAGTMLLAYLRATIGAVLVVVNTLAHTSLLFALALIKFVVPIAPIRRAISQLLVKIAESWIAINSMLMKSLARTRIHVDEFRNLRRDGRYLVLCNHQSWVDILVLQGIFNRRIPFMRFFLKSQLIWVPVLGLAWWALDFPFMRRDSKETLAAHPELRGRDALETRKACEKFRALPVSIMNFVEGTRFTPAKHDRQQSPYSHLLKPRSGGVALVIESMGEMLDSIVDVTLIYPQGRPTFGDLLCGRVRDVRANVLVRSVPAELLKGDYQNDSEFRARFQAWMNGLWEEKDERIRQVGG
ncbi:MAG: acyltransferase [Dokdonella sp.]